MVLKITEPMKQFDTNMQVHNINTKSRTDCCPYFWEKCYYSIGYSPFLANHR